MKINSLTAILHALNHADVRYLIAGGVAVNLHGYQRLTHDLDLVIQLEQSNIRHAMDALDELGYRPTAPVRAEDFADARLRQSWIESKGMKVFSLTSDRLPDTTLDVFVTEPFDFQREYERCPTVELDRDLCVRVVSIPTLIEMKEQAGRERDKDDIQHLKWLLEEKGNNG